MIFLFCLTPHWKELRSFERLEIFIHAWIPFLSHANQEICAVLKRGILQKFENYRSWYRMCPSKVFISNPISKILCNFEFRFLPHPKAPHNFMKCSTSWEADGLSASKEISLLIWNPDAYCLLLTNWSVSPILCQIFPVHNQCTPP
jgi:hypothetical protein